MKNFKFSSSANGKVFRNGLYSTAILAAAIVLAVLINLLVGAIPKKYTEFDLSAAKMYTLGSGFLPSPDHAVGLRYHGMSPIVSKLKHDGYMEAVAVKQTDVFKAAEDFARLETILPAPESAHAIFQAMEEARKCAETGEEKTILFGLTGTGYFDMYAYEAYNRGEMTDHIPTDEELEAGFATIPHIEGIQ